MNTKKILAFTLTAMMALSLGACSSGSGSADSTTAAETTVETEAAEETAAAEETEAAEEASAEGAVVTSTYEEGTAAAELAGLFNGGYTLGCIGSNENGTVANFSNADHTDFRQATCTMTDEQSAAFFNLDFMAEDYNQQVFDILAACEDLAIVTPELPDMTEYKAYEGKTVGDMEDAGFDFAAYNKDEDGNMVLDFYTYTDAGDTYTLRVIPDIAEDDDTIYDDESIKTLTVKEIIFWDFD